MTVGKSIGLNGKRWQNLRLLKLWAFEIFLCSMIPSYQSKHGDSCIIKPHSSTKYLKLVSSQIHHLWRLPIQGWGLILGRVFLEEETSFKGGLMEDRKWRKNKQLVATLAGKKTHNLVTNLPLREFWKSYKRHTYWSKHKKMEWRADWWVIYGRGC